MCLSDCNWFHICCIAPVAMGYDNFSPSDPNIGPSHSSKRRGTLLYLDTNESTVGSCYIIIVGHTSLGFHTWLETIGDFELVTAQQFTRMEPRAWVASVRDDSHFQGQKSSVMVGAGASSFKGAAFRRN